MKDINTIAYGVAELLTDLAPEIHLAPEYDLPELSTQRCVIVPVSRTSKRVSRKKTAVEYQYNLEIGLMYRAKELDNNALLKQTQEVADLLLGSQIRGARCIKADPAPLYDAEQIRERNQFTAVISVIYKEFEM